MVYLCKLWDKTSIIGAQPKESAIFQHIPRDSEPLDCCYQSGVDLKAPWSDDVPEAHNLFLDKMTLSYFKL